MIYLLIPLALIVFILIMPIKIRVIRNDEANDVDIYLLWLFAFHIDFDETVKYLLSLKTSRGNVTKESVLYNAGLFKRSYPIIKDIFNHTNITKSTIIYNSNFKNDSVVNVSNYCGWLLVSVIRRYLLSSFKTVKNEYYVVNSSTSRLAFDFEIIVRLRIINIIMAVIRNIKVLPKIKKYKEENSARTSNI